MPSTDSVNDLEKIALERKLTEYELAVMIVDVGFHFNTNIVERMNQQLSQQQVLETKLLDVLNEGAKVMNERRLKICDALLTRVWQNAQQKGSRIQPRYGTVGNAITQNLGEFVKKI